MILYFIILPPPALRTWHLFHNFLFPMIIHLQLCTEQLYLHSNKTHFINLVALVSGNGRFEFQTKYQDIACDCHRLRVHSILLKHNFMGVQGRIEGAQQARPSPKTGSTVCFSPSHFVSGCLTIKHRYHERTSKTRGASRPRKLALDSGCIRDFGFLARNVRSRT